MAVIGYDGRLRPASTGAMQNPESQFNADRVGRVAAAQPKFSEDVAKLLNDGGQKLVNYGSKVAQQGQELEDLKDAESIQAEKRQIEEEGRKIREDKTMTPDEKAAAGEGLSGRYPSEAKVEEGASHRDQMRARRRAMTLGEAAWQESYRIQQEADRMREASETAKFGSEATIADVNFGVWADENFPKMHAEGVKPEKARERLEKAFDEQNKDFVAGMNEEQKTEWRKIRGRVLAGALLRYGKSYNELVRKKAENDINIVVGGATVGANGAENAMVTADSVLESPTGRAAIPDANKRFELSIGTGIANTANTIKNISAETANAHAVYVEQAKELLAKNDVKGYEELTKSVKDKTEAVFNDLFSRIENDRKAVIRKIESNGNLSEEQKAALKQTVEDKYLKMKDEAEKAKLSAQASHRMKAKSASDKVGKANFKNLVDCLTGTSSDLSQGAVKAYKLLNTENFKDVRDAYPKSEETRREYLVMTYSNVAPERRAQHAVTDIKAAIANLDMSAKGDINLFYLEKILVSAATVFGADSDEYRDIASFAQRNIVNEKNKWGDETKLFVDDLVCGGDYSKWQKGASLEDKARRLRYIAYLDEITDPEEYKKAKESISSMWRTEKSFDMALGIGEISEKAAKALESAAVRAKEAAAGDIDAARVRPDDVYEEDQEIKAMEVEAEISKKEAQLRHEGLFGAEEAGIKAEEEYWFRKAKELGAIGKKAEIGDYDVGTTKMLAQLAVTSKKDKEKRDAYDKKRRPELEEKLKSLGLPLSRREYTSFLGIGGYSVNDIDEIELGVNWRAAGNSDYYDDRLTISEMEEIIRQNEYYKGRSNPSEIYERARREKSEKLKKEIEELKKKAHGT